MSRNTFIVAYDIADAKRLRSIARALLGFGERIQFSVFRCELSKTQHELLLTALTGILHHGEDRIVLIDVGPAEGAAGRRFRYLGRSLPGSGDDTLVI